VFFKNSKVGQGVEQLEYFAVQLGSPTSAVGKWKSYASKGPFVNDVTLKMTNFEPFP
jgi:hypothetical protein